MSSIATAQRRATSRSAQATGWARVLPLGISVDSALGLCLAGGLVLVAFLAAGGTELAPNTWVEVSLTALGALLAMAVVLFGAPGRAWGAGALLLFAALSAFTYASIAWSVEPSNSWLEANRTLSYLAAFLCALALARVAPRRWPALVGSVAIAATLISGYALLAKVFPAALDPSDPLGRLHVPLDYWNATGLMAALGLPACLWAGARPSRGPVLRALSVPAITILIAALVLSYSRGVLLAAAIGVGCWFALVPLRLRAALVLALGTAGGVAAALWALATHPLTHDRVSLHARTTAGHAFGLFLLLLLVLVTLAGFAAAFAMDRVVVPAHVRRRLSQVLVALVVLLPIGGVVALATSSRGLTGEVSHMWRTLTNPSGVVSDKPGRLVELANSRPHYWSEGLKVGEHHLLAGVGALGFATARARYSRDSWNVQHAHSYLIETFADFGLIGIFLSLALAVAWVIACARTLGVRGPPARPRLLRAPEHAGEFIGLLTMLAIVVTFVVHSLIDWTWFIPATAVAALACAGWLAGRGPLAQPVGRLSQRRRLASAPALVAVPAAIGALALIGVWATVQPLRSADADAAAITALTRGDTRTALTDAREAAARNPVAVEPLWELSAIYSAAGDLPAARRELVAAVSRQPSNPASWRRLGQFDLDQRHPRTALSALQRAQRLDGGASETRTLIATARAALRR